MPRLHRAGPLLLLVFTLFVMAGETFGQETASILATIVTVALVMPIFELGKIAGRARAGSLVDAADRRRPWLVGLAGALLMSLLRFDSTTPLLLAEQVAVGLAIVVMLGLDLAGLARLRHGLVGRSRLRARTAASPPIDATTSVYDFGVGDEELEELQPSSAVYRERERVVRVVRGSRRAAVHALAGWVVFDVAAALIVLVAFVAVVFAPAVYPY